MNKKLRMKKFRELKKEALDRLKELDKWQDDLFINVEFNHPLGNSVIRGNYSDMTDEADNLVYDGIFKEQDVEKLKKWFLSICRNYLIDRFSKIDWEAREEARKRLQRTLEGYLGIKNNKKEIKNE